MDISYSQLFGKLILFLILIFLANINNKIKQIEIDNLFNDNYEIDIDFSKYSTEIKAIAIYIPEEEKKK